MDFKNRILLVGFCLIMVHFSSKGETYSTYQESTSFDSIATSEDCEGIGDWHLLLEEMAESGIDSEEWEERLAELANNPISLNEASREMLESLPMLNPDLVENLSYYLYRYGPMVHLSELMLVEGMDAQTIKWLKPFICLTNSGTSPVIVPTMKKALDYGKHAIRFTLGQTLQQSKGYVPGTGDSTGYHGGPLHASIRYGFDYKGQLQWGIVSEKDPGEKWWDNQQNGFDYTSFHFIVKDAKRKNMCVLGDYKVRFGQGLVCGSGFSLGKNTSGIVPEQTGSYISRHFSTSEVNFMRGVALHLNLVPYLLEKEKKVGMDLTLFLSKKRLDSSVENGYFESISETGLHRTNAEKAQQNQLRQTVVGGHFGMKFLNVYTGLTAIGWQYDASELHSTDAWKVFHSTGKSAGNISADLRMVKNGFLTFAEIAFDHNGRFAMLAGTTFKPYPRMNVSLLGRKYNPEYVALFSNAFSEGTSTQNEEGIYTSTDFQLAKRIHMTGYLDIFCFPWLNYGVNTPSWGKDIAMEFSTSFGKNGIAKLLVKNKIKEKYNSNYQYPTHPTLPSKKSQIRFQINQKVGFWSMKTILYGNQYTFDKTRCKGLAIAQDLGMESFNNRLSMVLHAVLFHTESWENRIYLWEKDLPGTFSMPMLYGRGCRFSFFAKYNLQKLELQVKLANSVQPEMEHLGDGLEQILGNRRTEVRFQLSWKF